MNLKKLIIMITIFIICVLIGKDANAMTIVLDPGHGGRDTGAIAKDGETYERDINLKITRYLREYLSDYNVSVLLTHNGFSSGELEIYDRAMIARDHNADLFISLHINSSPSGDARGAEVYVTANNSLPKYNENTTKLGNKILNNLSNLGISNRGVKTRLITRDKTDVYSDGSIADYYGVIRYAMRGTKIDYGVVKPSGATSANVQKGEGVPTILIEHCFINNEDFNFINSDAKIKKIAEADGKAIVDYYNLKKKSETQNNYDGFMYGDANLDKSIDSADLLVVRKYLLGKIKINNETQLKAMDPNKDGDINSADLLIIRKHLLGTYKIQ